MTHIYVDEDRFEVTDARLVAWRASALKFTNKIRKALGEEPLEALLPGAVSKADRCVLSMSVRGEGLFSRTQYDFVDIFDVAPSGDPLELEYPDDDSEEADRELRPHIVASFVVPFTVKKFLAAFDDEQYPDLIDEDAAIILAVPGAAVVNGATA